MPSPEKLRAPSPSAQSAAPSAFIAAPHPAMLALELRAPGEWGALLPTWPALQQAPRGDGHSVIVFPGLTASDTSTYPLRRYLQSLGYAASGWQQGSNLGPRDGVIETATRQVLEAHQQSGRKVSLIGWSLGGIYAREIAKEQPDCVRCVITLGTPFAGSPRSTRAWRIYEWVSGRSSDIEAAQFNLSQAPAVPTTSIFSKTDGIVAWQSSVQSKRAPLGHEQIENIAVLASHFGIGLNPAAWWIIANRLAQTEGQWSTFERPSLHGLGRYIYPLHNDPTAPDPSA